MGRESAGKLGFAAVVDQGLSGEQPEVACIGTVELDRPGDRTGAELARGLSNYSSVEARLLCRKPSAEFEKLLGYTAEPEMVHRDNMVLTR